MTMHDKIVRHVLGIVVLLALGILAQGRTLQIIADPVQAAGTARVYNGQITIKSYNYNDYTFLRYKSAYNMYYPYLDWSRYSSHRVKSLHVFDVVVMENDYLKLVIVPSLGGRIYSLEFKPTGNNEFYSNTTLKPTQWGPPEQGWWVAAGGMEWCLPVEEHGYEWGAGWQATTSTEADGVRVILQDYLAADRLRAAITLFLPNDRASFNVTPRIENPTGSGIWFKYWTNAMVAPGPGNTLTKDFRFILPVDQATVHSSGDRRLPGSGKAFSWPVYNGIDWSILGNWNEWLGFFARPAAARDFQGVYDTGLDEGLARIFPHQIARGAKGFAWGWNNAYDAGAWTEGGDTYYAEIHGGIAPTFSDSAYLPPQGAIEWTETWYPVAGIGNLTTANAEAALNMQVNGSQVAIGAQPTITQTGGLLALCRPGEATPLHAHRGTLSPSAPYKTTLAPGGDLSGLVLAYLDQDAHLLATTAETTDNRPPAADIQPLPAYVTDPDNLIVSWSGSDRETCVIFYDVQVKDGYDGVWTDWLTHTQAISATYMGGVDGHTWFFRVRAYDLFGNVGGYGDAEWGQAFTSLLIDPTPVLETSRKWASARSAIGGDVITYTLSVRNTGSADTAAVWLTDTLPGQVRLLTGTLWSSSGLVSHTNEAVFWQGPAASGQLVSVTFAAQVYPTVTVDLSPVYNTAEIGDGENVFSRRAAFLLGRSTFFPLVFRNDMP